MRRFQWVGLFVWLAWSAAQPCAEAVILINEVLADPPAASGDANRDGLISITQDEFVELVNTGAGPVSLAGWTLSDAVQVRHVFSSSAAIPGSGFFVLFGGGSPQGFANAAIATSGSLGLNNAGDTVTVRDASALPIDAFTYGAEGGMDLSLTRSPDATGAFVKHSAASSSAFSPGATVDGLTSLVPPVQPEEEPDEVPNPSGGSAVPEPASLLLLGAGMLSVSMTRRAKTLF